MTIAAERLRLSIMAMTEAEQNALASVLTRVATEHREPRMSAFYAALATLVDESHAWAIVLEASMGGCDFF